MRSVHGEVEYVGDKDLIVGNPQSTQREILRDGEVLAVAGALVEKLHRTRPVVRTFSERTIRTVSEGIEIAIDPVELNYPRDGLKTLEHTVQFGVAGEVRRVKTIIEGLRAILVRDGELMEEHEIEQCAKHYNVLSASAPERVRIAT